LTEVIYEAPARSGESIESLADSVRRAVGLMDQMYFPVLEFLEFGLAHFVDGMEFDIAEAKELGAREGAVDPLKRVLYIRSDIYDAASKDNGRARFTVAHEIGHALMHVGTLNRALPSQSVPAYKNPEWQANRFSASLLMPRHLVCECYSVAQVMEGFVVSREAASLRAEQIGLQNNWGAAS
jgi:hypothetical protein